MSHPSVDSTAGTPEATLELLGKIIDISLDLALNRSDSEFATSGGEIFYVFDQNIFEVFIQPSKRANIVNSFHSQSLNPGRRRAEAILDQQVALITSEFLFSGQLAGHRRQTLYMTKEHRDELLRRIRALADDLEDEVGSNSDTAIKELTAKLQALAQLDANGGKSVDSLLDDDRLLKKDAQSLRALGADAATLRRFELARFASKLLAQSTYTEPLEQLQRLLTPPIFPRLRTLYLDFTPTKFEYDEIQADSRRWQKLLSEEREWDKERRARVGSFEEARSDTRIRNDALSLAFVRWAARKKLSANQRLVMVTGDKLLFNAYRRWYSSSKPNSPEYLEPFVLRRPSQYLPEINIGDSTNDISEGFDQHLKSKEIFARLLSVIEIALLPVNLAQSAAATTEVKRMDAGRRNQRMALALEYIGVLDDEVLNEFRRKLDQPWFERTRRQISEILEQLRIVERLSIGAFLSYVVKRLNDEHRELAGRVAQAGQANAGAVLQKRISDILHKVRDKSAQSWPLLAEEFIHALQPPAPNRRRVPLTMWYELATGEPIARLIGRWLFRSDAVNWLEVFRKEAKRYEAPFVIAATLALFTDQWSQADRFAATGVREYLSNNRPDSSPDYFETLFLSAVTKRFRLGNIAIDIAELIQQESGLLSRGLRLLGETYSGAISLLEQCDSFVASRIYKDADFTTLAKMRIFAERGTLNAFAAASYMPIQKGVDYDERRELTQKKIQLARDDLAKCLELQPTPDNGYSYKHLLELLKLQYVPMYLSTAVLSAIMNPEDPIDDTFASHEELAREYLEKYRAFSFPLVRAQLCAFLILIKGNEARREREELKRLVRDPAQSNLALDASLLVQIGNRFLGPNQ
jgi:hypothetical protein